MGSQYRRPISIRFNFLILLLAGLLVAGAGAGATGVAPLPVPKALAPIRNYIASGWDALTRSMSKCESVVDPKLAGPSALYLPAQFPTPASLQALQNCKVEIKHLPAVIHGPGEVDPSNISPPGLLYLENSYVVPGGRFNEMYGWDSYFIVLGLLRDGHMDLARGMVENFFFEIEHYGGVLNANRSYYLTRSQPPFLTSMILAVYEAQKTSRREDRDWLSRAYSYATRDHQMWTRDPHLAGQTGLARYFDFGEGPVPEGKQHETGYYRAAVAYYLAHPESADGDLVEIKQGADNPQAIGFTFPLRLCEERGTTTLGEPAIGSCEILKTLSLSRDFYKGDRAMRESGLDISFRFGPFGAMTHHYAPVCLNSLLYKTERDLERISAILQRKDDEVAWHKRAEERKEKINQYLWDQARGLFFDYDFQTRKQSSYEYASTFYPLWAGLATPAQARAVAQNVSLFEQAGGLAMSRHASAGQWDYPYGWAPLQLLAVEGLRRYGYNADADRISYEFLSTVADNFRRTGSIVEKYNVVTRSSETHVEVGYKENVVGFGWTNGVFLELLHQLPQDLLDRLAKEQAGAAIGSAQP